jgi:hypothetical protein
MPGYAVIHLGAESKKDWMTQPVDSENKDSQNNIEDERPE